MNMKKAISDWKRGLLWGVFMLIWMELLMPAFQRDKSIDLSFLPIAFIFWIFFGSWLIGWGSAAFRAKR